MANESSIRRKLSAGDAKVAYENYLGLEWVVAPSFELWWYMHETENEDGEIRPKELSFEDWKVIRKIPNVKVTYPSA